MYLITHERLRESKCILCSEVFSSLSAARQKFALRNGMVPFTKMCLEQIKVSYHNVIVPAAEPVTENVKRNGRGECNECNICAQHNQEDP